MNPRSRSRRVALQALYQWQMAGHDPQQVETQYLEDENSANLDAEYFQTLFRHIVEEADNLDRHLSPSLDRPIQQLDPIERAILRIGAYELLHCIEVPWRVVINESVELAKTFGAEQSHRYINGILDKLARTTRQLEIQG